MIDTTKWNYLYKLDYINKHQVNTNMLYTPLISPDGSMLCLCYNTSSDYQNYNNSLTQELLDFFFDIELKNLRLFQGQIWAPKIIEEDISNKKIFIEFNKETLNYPLVLTSRDINQEIPNWKEQIFNILKDINTAGYYKMSLYPHCFFMGIDGNIKTIDFYACLPKDDCKIPRNKIETIIGNQSTERFDKSTIDDYIDFKIFFEITMKNHLANTWTDNPFPEYYKRLFYD
jgi:hypothetical protein